MTDQQNFEVAIIGGSYAGLSAAMTLGRALRKVIIIDSGKPCNRQTPHSHNLVTHDGKTPAEIAALARAQVLAYPTVALHAGLAVKASGKDGAFTVETEAGEAFLVKKLIFAAGVKDIMLEIPGFAECWGISVIHCPYCHGYEYRGQRTGIIANGEAALEFVKLIRHWTDSVTLYTNGPAKFDDTVRAQILGAGAALIEQEIESIEHEQGYITALHFRDGSEAHPAAVYSRVPFVQHCPIPGQLGCALTEHGYIQADATQKTTVAGIYAAGDSTTMFRTLTGALATGTMAAARVNHELIHELY